MLKLLQLENSRHAFIVLSNSIRPHHVIVIIDIDWVMMIVIGYAH
jgi:hypothetical protein